MAYGGRKRTSAIPESDSAPTTSAEPVRRVGKEERRARRLGEAAGETAAECAAICCCCPCCVVKILVIVAVKLPQGLVRCALRHCKARCSRNREATERKELRASKDKPAEACPARSPAEAMYDLENVMRDNFYGGGFWRSLSRRE
ncbi:uncharacterized protein LOC122001724 [Zingiber officinale]|uniref:uncharacterized protein LOC122001724 n=1 Tax=Zingiber officinale TaxID=94328 RepID=UPI001C4D461A|nr:uncharacterized protein LOC122001724 [Zingiber officinale]XP_042412550.1 uncharacterized protein LOC122001724 [Zingiber officinale]XP_042412551.1 uncharacterized protein LOC122001724 [Zingiber officinale]